MAAAQTSRDATGQTAAAWRALRDAPDIQFAPVTPVPPPETPAWLQTLGQWLRDLLEPLGRMIGLSWPTIQNVLIALAILLTLAVAWVLLRPLIEQLMTRRQASPDEEWSPDRGAAIALLEDADLLAREGRFDEAVHLLLQRSVSQIAQARPEWLQPASTAREIARIPALPAKTREAFTVIAIRVERSLFALGSLDAGDWQAARDAYARFALAELPA